MDEKTFQIMQQALEMVGTGGESAGWLVALWIGKGYLTGLLGFAGFLIVNIVFYKLISRAMFRSDIASRIREDLGLEPSRLPTCPASLEEIETEVKHLKAKQNPPLFKATGYE